MRMTLTPRNRGVEALLASVPYDPPERLDPLRQWAVCLMDDVSRFEIERRRLGMSRAGRIRKSDAEANLQAALASLKQGEVR